LWGIIAPLIVRLARGYSFERGNTIRRLAVHAPASVLLPSLHLVLYEMATRTLDPALVRSMTPSEALQGLFVARLPWGVLIYWTIVFGTHGLDYYRRFREKELRASQLEAELTRAQLRALQMQLQPHFLFNTLHTISALVRSDPDAADRTIAQLSDLLRMTLARIGLDEVSLEDELQFVEHYLTIERTRFHDRLSVGVDVQPAALTARVPWMILQPLVENAIKHGIGVRAGAGRIEISARRDGDHLRMSVLDDGRGFPSGNGIETTTGIGLRSTRERLLRLYGEDHRMEIGSGPAGGTVVSIWIPFCPGAGE
jgi:LytS/YehU family sensor histidine kinase